MTRWSCGKWEPPNEFGAKGRPAVMSACADKIASTQVDVRPQAL